MVGVALSPQDWERKYIHVNWSQVLQDNFTVEEVYCVSVL